MNEDAERPRQIVSKLTFNTIKKPKFVDSEIT